MAHRIQTNFPLQATLSSLRNKMMEAVKAGDVKTVQSLLNQGLSVNELLPNKEFPLHSAIHSDQNSIEMVRFLIRSGANLDAIDGQNLTALDRAILLENVPLTQVILREKIGLSAKTALGQAEHACSSGYLSELKDRVDQILSINSLMLEGRQKSAYEGNLKELEKAKELNQLDKHGFAPIHYAILGDKQSAFQALLKAGANPRLLTRSGDSILHLAAMKGSLPLIQLALDAGVQPNFQNRRGETALHYAAVQEHLNGMKALIEKGANPSATDVRAASPLAIFTAKVRSRDPLSISPLLLPQAAFGILYLWQLWQLKSIGSLTTSRWSPALSLAFLGLTITESIQATKNVSEEKKSLSHILTGTEGIPGLGLGCSIWKTGHVVSSSFQMIKKGWDHLETRKWAGFQNIAIGSIHLASSLALLGTTTLLHAQWFKGSPQVPDYTGGPGMPPPVNPPGTPVDPGIPPQPSQPVPQPHKPSFTSPLPGLPKCDIQDVNPEPQNFPFWIHGPKLPLPFLKLVQGLKFSLPPAKFERNPYALTSLGLCGAPSFDASVSHNSAEGSVLASANLEIESLLPFSDLHLLLSNLLPHQVEQNPLALTSPGLGGSSSPTPTPTPLPLSVLTPTPISPSPTPTLPESLPSYLLRRFEQNPLALTSPGLAGDSLPTPTPTPLPLPLPILTLSPAPTAISPSPTPIRPEGLAVNLSDRIEQNPLGLTNFDLSKAPSFDAFASHYWFQITQDQSVEIPLFASDDLKRESSLHLTHLTPGVEPHPFALPSLSLRGSSSPTPTLTPLPLPVPTPSPTPTPISPSPAPIHSQGLPFCDLFPNPDSLKNLSLNATTAMFTALGMTSEAMNEILEILYPVSRPAPSPILTLSSPTPVLTSAPTFQEVPDRLHRQRYLSRKDDLQISDDKLLTIDSDNLETTLENTSNDGKLTSPANITGTDNNLETLKSNALKIAFGVATIYVAINSLWKQLLFYTTKILLPLLGLGIRASSFFIPRKYTNEILHLENRVKQKSLLNGIPIVGTLFGLYTSFSEDGKKVVNFSQRKLVERLPRDGWGGRLRKWLKPAVAAPLLPLPSRPVPLPLAQQPVVPHPTPTLPLARGRDDALLQPSPSHVTNNNLFGSVFIPSSERDLGILHPSPATPTTTSFPNSAPTVSSQSTAGAGLGDAPSPRSTNSFKVTESILDNLPDNTITELEKKLQKAKEKRNTASQEMQKGNPAKKDEKTTDQAKIRNIFSGKQGSKTPQHQNQFSSVQNTQERTRLEQKARRDRREAAKHLKEKDRLDAERRDRLANEKKERPSSDHSLLPPSTSGNSVEQSASSNSEARNQGGRSILPAENLERLRQKIEMSRLEEEKIKARLAALDRNGSNSHSSHAPPLPATHPAQSPQTMAIKQNHIPIIEDYNPAPQQPEPPEVQQPLDQDSQRPPSISSNLVGQAAPSNSEAQNQRGNSQTSHSPLPPPPNPAQSPQTMAIEQNHIPIFEDYNPAPPQPEQPAAQPPQQPEQPVTQPPNGYTLNSLWNAASKKWW